MTNSMQYCDIDEGNQMDDWDEDTEDDECGEDQNDEANAKEWAKALLLLLNLQPFDEQGFDCSHWLAVGECSVRPSPKARQASLLPSGT